MEKWYDQEEREMLSCSIFSVHEMKRKSEGGEKGSFYVLRAPDWATVVPLIYDENGRRCFIMVEQYRHGSGEVTMEFPAGTVDPGEGVTETAERELLEETGYSCRSLEQIGALSPNPAFMDNTTYTFLAEGLRPEGEQNLDRHESMYIHSIAVEEVRRKMGTGAYNNAIMVSALALFNKRDRDGCM